ATGLAMLLFRAGREIDYSRLRGPTVELAALGMAVSLVFALAIAFGLRLQHLVGAPVFVAIVLSATGLGTLTPIFEDAPEVSGVFYRLVSTPATFGEVTPLLLLPLLFSRPPPPARPRPPLPAPVRGAGPRDRPRTVRRERVAARQGGPDPAAGHDRADPHPDRGRALRRVRCPGRRAGLRGGPGRVRRRRDPETRRQGRPDGAPA